MTRPPLRPVPPLPAGSPAPPPGEPRRPDLRALPALSADRPASATGRLAGHVPTDIPERDPPVPADMPEHASPPVSTDIPERAGLPVPTDMPERSAAPAPADTSDRPAAPVPADMPERPAAPAPADMFDAPHLWLVPPPAPAHPPPPPQALAELDALLARSALDDPAIARLVALAPQVPGRQRAVVAALAASDSPAALAALLALPDAPGALAAACRHFQAGRTRRLSAGPGEPGPLAPPFAALEFRPSRARPFPDLLRRAQRLAADPSGALRLDALRDDGRVRYRLSFWPAELDPPRRAALARAAGPDLALLHARLSRLRGARLWLSGFLLAGDGPVSPPARAHLLAAFLSWAEGPGR